jgi:hypothetical protein
MTVIKIWSWAPMDVAIFWDIAPCGPYVNLCFRGTYHLHLQSRKSAEQGTSMHQMAKHVGSHTDYAALHSRR